MLQSRSRTVSSFRVKHLVDVNYMHIYYSVFDGAGKRMKESIFIKIPQEIEKNLDVDCYIRINNIIMLWNQLICFSRHFDERLPCD